MIKIDLHLHSEISKSNGDVIKWPSDYFVVKKLLNNKIKIASFTDHNRFDYDFYKSISALAKTAGILVLPGLELNVARKSGIRANMLYIFSDKLTDTQLKELHDLTLSIRKSGIPLDEVNSKFKKFDPILIPHVGKSDYFTFEDLSEIEYHAIEVSNVKHANYKSFMKKQDKTQSNVSVVAFSDTHTWDKYPQVNKLYTVIETDDVSFDALKNELQKNKKFINER